MEASGSFQRCGQWIAWREIQVLVQQMIPKVPGLGLDLCVLPRLIAIIDTQFVNQPPLLE